MDAAAEGGGSDASTEASPTGDAGTVADGGVINTRVVIIGSGFGGSVTALRLAERGIPSVVLERGKRWVTGLQSNTFASLLNPDRRSAWMSTQTVLPFGPVYNIQKYVGVLERIRCNGINLYAGAAVGGGSVVYGGFAVVPRESAFTHVFPREISYAEMMPLYERAKTKLRASTIPADVLAHPEFNSERVFLAQAAAAGVETTQVFLTVDWDIVRKEFTGEANPSAIQGEVIYGNSNGCKISLDKTYLADAEATGMCSVMPLHRVRDISQDASGKYQVFVERISESGDPVETKVYVCDYLFLAAGTFGTTSLLVKAKAKGLLRNLDNNVGQNFGNNGNSMFMRWGLRENTGPIQASFGGQAMVDFNNPVSAGLVEHAQFPSGVECNCLLHLCMVLDVGAGTFRYVPDSDSVTIDWPMSATDTPVAAMMNLTQRLRMANNEGDLNGSALGGTVTVNGILRDFTYHPLGGMVIGQATDFYGRVNNYQKLYVIDGALLPRSAGGVNPALTITALAERNIANILSRDFT